MAILTLTEKYQLEKVLKMKDGYVLDFSNRAFAEFIHSACNIDIYNGNYETKGSSKANHLRDFWEKEPNHVVGHLLFEMLNYGRAQAELSPLPYDDRKPELWEACLAVAERLQRDSVVENIGALKPNTDDRDFTILAHSIRESIEKNEPHVALDRLHTFCIKYFRAVCRNRELQCTQEEPLNSIFGKYVKHLESEGIVEAKITTRILKSSITILSDFNDVRNNRSFAHDNQILNYHESLLIFNNITNTIKFIEYIEGTHVAKGETEDTDPFEDIPF